ncbi:condensin complex subunit 2 [Phtheirospermum japonicum]|uniref:Condensin complex subunit 2 n=1 Tax=Phtheirospermum japonicum TaxID=374723 RepID=A0A830B2J1_9LAMI|nr:condensin complex subunit 2 [Phtheirospermum japonicum]
MVSNMQNKTEISPSLRAIINQLDDDDRRRFESNCSGQSSSGQVNDSPERNVDFDGDTFGDSGTWDFDNDDQGGVADDGAYDQNMSFPNQQEVPDLSGEQSNVHDSDEYDRFEEVDSYLFSSLGFSTKHNAWAGPNHWKFQKAKEPEAPAMENGSPKPKKTKNKKADLDIDFSNAMENDISLIFAPPKNPKSLLLPANRAPSNTKLPEDCHYQPEDLVKLFLLPHVLCLGKSGRKKFDDDGQQRDGYEATSWDDDDGFGGAFDDENAYGDDFEEPSSTLVSQPRQVNKVEVQYDKTSKQVDVHALKETLWDHIQQSNQNSVEEEVPNGNVSFKQVLASFPDGCKASASLNDISPHLCFICLLHLANEHGLRIIGCPSLDDLSIHLKP